MVSEASLMEKELKRFRETQKKMDWVAVDVVNVDVVIVVAAARGVGGNKLLGQQLGLVVFEKGAAAGEWRGEGKCNDGRRIAAWLRYHRRC